MKPMTRQQIFDKAAKHLIRQGDRAWDEGEGRCAYRSPTNLKCAVGCLIPDVLYHHSMEAKDVADIIKMFPNLENIFSPKDVGFLMGLQAVHDSCDSWQGDRKAERVKTFKNALRKFAKQYKLKTTALGK